MYKIIFLIKNKTLFIGSESDAVASELRKRKESQTVEPSANTVETIAEPTQEPDEPVSKANDEKPSEPSVEAVKSVDDKKNE